MVNSRILIMGKVEKEPKIHDNGSVDLILINELEKTTGKDIRDKGNSIFLVHLSKGQWRLIRKQISKPEKEIRIIGSIKATVNKKGTPYVYVSAEGVQSCIIEDKTQSIKSKFKTKHLAIQIKNPKDIYIPWRQQVREDEFIELDSSKVELVEDDHINAKFKWLDLEKGRGYTELVIAVRKIDDDKYALVSGIARFIIGKTFNRPFKAYVTDLTRDEFAEEFEIKGENKDL